MDLSNKLTTMTDTELANLSANAARMGLIGTEGQRRQAASLAPLVDAEMKARKAAKLAEIRSQPGRTTAAPARTRKKAVAAAPAA